jgi:DNA polymerase III delta subunit
MKIIVIHGDDFGKSSARLKTFREVAIKRGWEYQKISDAATNIPELLSGQDLFTSEKLVIVDDPKLINSGVTEWLNKNYKLYNTTLVIYSDKKLPATFIKSLPNETKVEESKLPTKLWTMLDSFYPGNQTNCLKLLHEVSEAEPIEFIFSLLSKQIRDMYWLMEDPGTFYQKGWRATKLTGIAKKFGKEKLKTLINEFADIDIKSKTSDANLLDLLDFVIIAKLK